MANILSSHHFALHSSAHGGGGVRWNWRLLVAIGATVAFWLGVAAVVIHLS